MSWKKFNFKNFMTQDSIGHLKTLCMSVLSLAVVFESEWKRYSSSQSVEKTLAFKYEFSFRENLNYLDVMWPEISNFKI